MENTNTMPQNKMATMNVNKLILNMSLPMMFSMFILALYNIIDSFFVAKINEEALTAVSLAFPVQNLMTSFSVGTGVGINALLSRRLGEQNKAEVNKTALNGLFLAFCTAIAFVILGFFFLKPYVVSQTSNATIIQYSLDYMYIVVYGCIISFMGITFERLLQSTGRTMFTMVSQLCGAITNIILDPLMIFGIGIFPAMGVKGAAIATLCGQTAGLLVSAIANFTSNPDISLKIKGFKPNGTIIAQIYKVGIPSIILSSITSVTTYFMNLILGAFTSTAIAFYGSYFKLNSFIFMPVFGLNSGVVPIIAFNYGAKNKERIQKTIRTTIIMAMGIMIVGALIFELFPGLLLKIFSASDVMLSIGIPAMRIIAPSFIGAALAISLSSVFQAFGKATYSMIISIVRQIVVLLPSAYLLSFTGNITLVWLCFPIAEIASIGLALYYLGKVNKTVLKTL